MTPKNLFDLCDSSSNGSIHIRRSCPFPQFASLPCLGNGAQFAYQKRAFLHVDEQPPLSVRSGPKPSKLYLIGRGTMPLFGQLPSFPWTRTRVPRHKSLTNAAISQVKKPLPRPTKATTSCDCPCGYRHHRYGPHRNVYWVHISLSVSSLGGTGFASPWRFRVFLPQCTTGNFLAKKTPKRRFSHFTSKASIVLGDFG